MILLSNGCSWTFGGSLNLDYESQTEQRLASVWPHHLGKNLNANEVINLGAGCGSNQRIIRTTFEWLLKQSPEQLKDTVAVIQWTEPTRYEYYEPIEYNNSLENIPNRWAKVKVDVCLQSEHTPDGYNFAFERSQRRFETNSYQENMYESIDRLSAMARIFETFGVKYFYWNYIDFSYTYPQNIKEYYINQFPWIDNPGNDPAYMTVEDLWQYDRVSPTDAHPSFQGHRELADIIYSKIKDQL